MTKPPAAPKGDPSSDKADPLNIGIANARPSVERNKFFRSKTTAKLKEMVFAKLLNLKTNDDSSRWTNPDNEDSATNEPHVLSESTKVSISNPKVQTSISDLFKKKNPQQPHSQDTQKKEISINQAHTSNPNQEELQDINMPDVSTTATSNKDLNPMKDTGEPEEESVIPSPPSTPKFNQPLPEGFTTAAKFTDHVSHGTAQEISMERLKFEVPIDSQTVDDAMIHTKALVILGRLVNEDPSRKVVAFKTTDEKYWKPLEKTHEIPQTMESMRKYIADPTFNSKTQRLVFHIRFLMAKPLHIMKRNSTFMQWLKKERIWLSVNQITSTNNKRVGFFIGKMLISLTLQHFTPLSTKQ
jgi:hypothetical protein